MLTGQGHDRTFWSGVNILYLNLVMVTWVYTFVRTHQAILLRSVCFTLWEFYFNKEKNLTTNLKKSVKRQCEVVECV